QPIPAPVIVTHQTTLIRCSAWLWGCSRFSFPPQPERRMGAARTTATAEPRAPDPDRSPDIPCLIPRTGGRKLHKVRPLLVGIAAALVLGAQISPLAHWADTRSFAAHMAQHLLIGDLAPLALAIGLGGFFRRVLNPALTLPLWM